MARLIVSFLFLAALFCTGEASAQLRNARQEESHSTGTPLWTNAPAFGKDVWTFTRLRYDSYSGWDKWKTDFPDSDLNLSYRVQQMTSIPTDPDARVIDITDPELLSYPWVYIVEPGNLVFSEQEVVILRRYLLNGGFLMCDDFWGVAEYENLHEQLKRVFPTREPVELPIEHPIFHCVFDIKEKPQVPNVHLGMQSQYNGGITWERPDAKTPEYKAIFDDKGRIMVMICHNTDLGDGWEREGEYEYFFREFSEKKAFPLGINIIVYSMTH